MFERKEKDEMYLTDDDNWSNLLTNLKNNKGFFVSCSDYKIIALETKQCLTSKDEHIRLLFSNKTSIHNFHNNDDILLNTIER